MSDVIPVPTEALRWLRELARAHDSEESGWSEAEPYSAWEELLAIGFIEHRPPAFRLSDIGWWALSRLIPEGSHDI